MTKIFFLLFIILIQLSKPTPVAFFHGFSQKCSNYDETNIVGYIKTKTNDYVRCIETGGGSIDISRSFEDQAKKGCEIVSSEPKFQNDFYVVSISQGGILARYLIEKCEMKGKVKRFISIGGPLAGTHQLPHCLRGVVCHILNSFTDWFCYTGYVQKTLGPSWYFRISNHLERYKKSLSILLNVNNLGKYDEEAKKRFSNLEKLVLIQFKRDTMITPKQSAFFQELDENHNLVDMKETEIYKNDLFGLKTLNEAGRIEYHLIDEKHCYFGWEDFNDYVTPYLT